MGQSNDNLPVGWVLTQVGLAGEVRVGRQRSPDKHTGQYPTKYVRAANITPTGLDLSDLPEMDFTPAEREVYTLRDGDVLLTEASGSSAHVGRAVIWREEAPGCCYQNTVIRFRPTVTLPQYALLVFRHYAVSGVFARTARGVGIQHLGAKRLAELDFPLPPLAEQRRIVAEASRRLKEIREARNLLENSLALTREQNKQIIAAAVSGELVEPEYEVARRENREFESADMLLSHIADQHEIGQLLLTAPVEGEVEGNDAEEGTFLSALPIGWTVVPIGQTGQVLLGKARNPRESRQENSYPYLRVANVYEDRIDASDVLEMPFSRQEHEKYLLQSGDVLLNEGQSPELVGRPAIYRGEVPGACFQNSLIRYRPYEAVLPEYALLVFRLYLHSGVFRAASRWTTNIAHLSAKRFAAIPMPVPPRAEQERIIADAQRRLDESAAQERSIRTALSQLSGLEVELFASAVEGRLSRQELTDQPAIELLGRYTVDSPAEPVTPRSSTGPDESSRVMEKVKNGNLTHQEASDPASSAARTRLLADLVREAGQPLDLPELLMRAGFDPDSTQEVEEFYVALRAELGVTLQEVEVSGRRENVTVKVFEDAIG